MKKTPEIAFGFAVLFLMGLVFWHMQTVVSSPDDPSVIIVTPSDNITADVKEFRLKLEEGVRVDLGQPIEGFEPSMFMQVFPGLLPEDFDGVEAMIGEYEYEDGVLKHDVGYVDMVHSAAPAVTEEGVETLLKNVVTRLKVDTEKVSVREITTILRKSEGSSKPSEGHTPPPEPVSPGHPVACPMDAKICPDGSAVGRSGPDCEFSACYNVEPSSQAVKRYGENVAYIDEYRSDCSSLGGVFNECASACSDSAEMCIAVCSMTCVSSVEPNVEEVFECSPESKVAQECNKVYAPVCGLADVQCVTAPCNPIPKTFSNSCFACAQGNVYSYEEGSCSAN